MRVISIYHDKLTYKQYMIRSYSSKAHNVQTSVFLLDVAPRSCGMATTTVRPDFLCLALEKTSQRHAESLSLSACFELYGAVFLIRLSFAGKTYGMRLKELGIYEKYTLGIDKSRKKILISPSRKSKKKLI